MVGAGHVVAERHGAVGADEDRAGATNLGGDVVGIPGVDLEVLRAIGVGHLDGLRDVLGEDHGRLDAGERLLRAREVLGVVGAAAQRLLHALGELLRVGDEDGSGQGVVLGLAEKVGGDELGVGGVVRDDRDLRGACLGIDADHAVDRALSSGDVHVAGAGDDVDGVAQVLGSIGEHGDCLGSASGVDLVDAEQRACREDRGVRLAAEFLLRGRRDRDGRYACRLRGDHVHDHRAGVDGQAAGHVQAHTAHGDPPLRELGSRCDLDRHRRRDRGLVEGAHAGDGLAQRVDHRLILSLQRLLDALARHTQVLDLDAVELRRVLAQGVGATLAHVLDDGRHGLDGVADVEISSGHHLE